jgi:hypothetical protein
VEELRIELRKGVEVAPGDLEPHHGCTHLDSSCL